MGRPLHLLPTHSLQDKSHHPPYSFPSLLASTSLRSPFPGPTIRPSVPARTTAIRSSMAATATEAPPRAKKVRHEMEMFGDVRVDEYYWIRDDSRKDPEVLAHLAAENSYTDEVMSGEKELQDQLYAEMRGRIKEADVSVPLRKGAYYYYEKNLEGKEYIQHCRRRVPDEGAPLSVHDVMPTHSDAPPEYVILDENVKAQGHRYYRVGGFEVSPDNKLVAYAEDTKGNEIYTVYIIDAETGVPVEKPLVGVTSYFEWAGNSSLIYITMDEILREDKVWLHKLGTDQSADSCLYFEEDVKFSLSLTSSESKRYLFVSSSSKNTTFIFYLDVAKPEEGLKVLTSRTEGIATSSSHRGDHFFIERRSDECFNSEVLACPVDDVSNLVLLIPHRRNVKIQGIQLFRDHLVVYQREGGLPTVVVHRLPAVGHPLGSLEGGRSIDFIDPVYSVEASESQFSSNVLRFTYTSLKTPETVYDYDMDTGVSVVKKTKTVLGDFDSSKYVTERKWASADDGTQIPVSIVYKKDLVKLDGSDPLLLYGYGSYEVPNNLPAPAPQIICENVDSNLRSATVFLLDNAIIGNYLQHYKKYRRYVTLLSNDIYTQLVNLYATTFKTHWPHFKGLVDHASPPTPATAHIHAARIYISMWFHDLYCSNQVATKAVSPLAFNEKFHTERVHYSTEYDAFLTLLDASLKPTHIKYTPEDTLYVPIIADDIDWTSEDNPFNINNYVNMPEIGLGIVQILRERKLWNLQALTTNTIGHPCWLFDWHINDQVCAWFPREGNFNDNDVALAYIIRVACTPKLGPIDVDEWQYMLECNILASLTQNPPERVTSRHTHGSYSVRTYNIEDYYTLPEDVADVIYSLSDTGPTRHKRSATGKSKALSITSGSSTPSTQEPTGPPPKGTTEAIMLPTFPRFRIVDWCYHACVCVRIDWHSRIEALKIMMSPNV